MTRADVVIIGGGFYGCCLALFCRSVTKKVVLLEACDRLMSRASFVNQARIHTGFHYPRSFATAKRSLSLSRRFKADFKEAVVDDFRMLYAVARRGSKVSAHRFYGMFRNLGAPIRPVSRADAGLFDDRTIDAAFECDEFAFDASRLTDLLERLLDRAGVSVLCGVEVSEVCSDENGEVCARLVDGSRIAAALMLNATYSCLNRIRRACETDLLPLKNELAEIALMRPPRELSHIGITVMDGPFFSLIPFPTRGLHSLTHVRYTPQMAWLDGEGEAVGVLPKSRWMHMVRDATRYVPAAADLVWEESLFEVKTVLLRNEVDDGRPILLHRHRGAPGFYSVLGGKLDNIYDLLAALRDVEPARLGRANLKWLTEERRDGV